MTRLAKVPALLLGFTGCHPSPAPEASPSPTAVVDEPATTEPPANEEGVLTDTFDWQHEYATDDGAGPFALVRPGATLRAQPNGSRGWVYDGLHNLIVQVIAREPDFVEIQLDWPDRPTAYHCAGARADGLGLRLFVDEADLADVTTRATTVEFPGGGGINVAAGVPVTRQEDGRMRLSTNLPTSPQHVSALHFTVSVEPVSLDLGKFYVPTSFESLPAPLSIEAKGELRYAGGTLRFATLLDRVYEQTKSGQMSIGSPCLQVAGDYFPLSPEDDWHRPNGGGGCSPGVPYDPAWDVRVGAKLSWPNGSEAGHVLHPTSVLGRLYERGTRRCFDVIIGCSEDFAIRACVSADDISEGVPLDFSSTGLVSSH